MELRFTPRAVDDIGEIADYLKERSPAAALNVRAAIYRSLSNCFFSLSSDVGRQPKAFVSSSRHDTRI